jgi:hypothetical protein
MLQTSPEAPLVFVLLHKLFSVQPPPELKKAVLGDQGITPDEFQVSNEHAVATIEPSVSSVKLLNFKFSCDVTLYSLNADGIIK